MIFVQWPLSIVRHSHWNSIWIAFEKETSIHDWQIPLLCFHICDSWSDKYKYKLLKIGASWVEQSTKSWRFKICCQKMWWCTRTSPMWTGASTSHEWPPSVPIFLPNATLDILILTNSLACHKPFSSFCTFDRIKKRAFSYPFWTTALWAVLRIMIIFDLFASTALHTAQDTFRHVLHFSGLGILVVSDFHLRWV